MRGLLTGYVVWLDRNSVVSLLGPPQYGLERGSHLASRSYSRPARTATAQEVVEEDPHRLRRSHIEEMRRQSEYARQHNQPAPSGFGRFQRPGPDSTADVNEARRASNQAASTSAAGNLPPHLGTSARKRPQNSGSSSGSGRKLAPPNRNGRSASARSAATAVAERQATQTLPDQEAFKRMLNQPGVSVMRLEDDSFVCEEYRGPVQAYKPEYVPPQRTASSEVQRLVSPLQLHEQNSNDILPEDPAQESTGSTWTEASFGHSEDRGQASVSTPGSTARMTAGTPAMAGSGASFQAGGIGLRSGSGSSSCAGSALGSYPGQPGRQRLVTASAQSDAASQVMDLHSHLPVKSYAVTNPSHCRCI